MIILFFEKEKEKKRKEKERVTGGLTEEIP